MGADLYIEKIHQPIAQKYEPCKKCNPPAMPKDDTKAADKTDKK